MKVPATWRFLRGVDNIQAGDYSLSIVDELQPAQSDLWDVPGSTSCLNKVLTARSNYSAPERRPHSWDIKRQVSVQEPCMATIRLKTLAHLSRGSKEEEPRRGSSLGPYLPTVARWK
jgi:hypothetical protein